MIELIRESGYFVVADKVHELEIERHLRDFPYLIDSWQCYSEDQRTSPAWYLVSPRPDASPTEPGWRVGFYSPSQDERHERAFSDGYSACAYFIKQQAERLRAIAETV